LDIQTVRADLAAIERDGSLDDELKLAARVEALAQLEFADEFLRLSVSGAEQAALRRRVARAQQRLEQVDERLFEQARARFQSVARASRTRESDPARTVRGELRTWLDRFTAYRREQSRPLHTGYDALDALVDGALRLNEIPAPTRVPEREMIHLEPTPARVVLEMVDRVPWRPEDVFYDIGSGLGQVPILVHLLTGVRAVGVEIEPAYCRVARKEADKLGLAGVSFVESDARAADYGQGTVFYLFTPFVGEMLQAVLDRLEAQVAGRAVTLCSYGPCNPHLARQDWLRSADADPEHEFKLALFAGARHSRQVPGTYSQ
jgi:SAM-dependent methyltransferase